MTHFLPSTVYLSFGSTPGRTTNDYYFDYLMTFVQIRGFGGIES